MYVFNRSPHCAKGYYHIAVHDGAYDDPGATDYPRYYLCWGLNRDNSDSVDHGHGPYRSFDGDEVYWYAVELISLLGYVHFAESKPSEHWHRRALCLRLRPHHFLSAEQVALRAEFANGLRVSAQTVAEWVQARKAVTA